MPLEAAPALVSAFAALMLLLLFPLASGYFVVAMVAFVRAATPGATGYHSRSTHRSRALPLRRHGASLAGIITGGLFLHPFPTVLPPSHTETRGAHHCRARTVPRRHREVPPFAPATCARLPGVSPHSRRQIPARVHLQVIGQQQRLEDTDGRVESRLRAQRRVRPARCLPQPPVLANGHLPR